MILEFHESENVKLFGWSRRHGAVTSPSLPSPNDRAIYRVTR